VAAQQQIRIQPQFQQQQQQQLFRIPAPLQQQQQQLLRIPAQLQQQQHFDAHLNHQQVRFAQLNPAQF